MPPKPPHTPRSALYVRLPKAHAERLDRAAFELKVSKQDLVAGLIEQHVDSAHLGRTPPGFTRRETTVEVDEGLTIGRASFRPAGEREVMSLAEVAAWLEVEEDTVRELAEADQLPGRKLGDQWRFARQAILDWLAHE
jgi:excisionase family DNA binding protein